MSAPLTTDNPNNHGGLIVIITSMNIVLIIVSLAARVYASLQRRIVQQDDVLFGVLVVSLSIHGMRRILVHRTTCMTYTKTGSGNHTGSGSANTSSLWLGDPNGTWRHG